MACLRALGDDGGVGGQVPGGDLVGVQGAGAGEEQGDVVGGAVGQQGVEDGVADGRPASGRGGARALRSSWSRPSSMSRSRASIRPSV